jgi:adenylate cyclase
MASAGALCAASVFDHPALDDLVDTAARLQSPAETGQIVMSERLFGRVPSDGTNSISRTVALDGKREAERAGDRPRCG